MWHSKIWYVLCEKVIVALSLIKPEMTETGLDAAGLCGSFPLGYDHPLLDIFLPAMTSGC